MSETSADQLAIDPGPFDQASAPPQGRSPADLKARRIAEYMLSQEGTGPAWGIDIEAVNLGYARLAMTLKPDMLNGMKNAHGGMLFALADTAFAYACNSANAASVAFSITATFLTAGKPGERLIAEAKARHQAARTGVYDMAVYGADGRAIALFSGISRTVGGKTCATES
jgi:acyl-CoA thioesterase